VRLLWIGVYGLGFAYILAAAMSVGPRLVFRALGVVALACFAVATYVPKLPPTPAAGSLHVAGVQLESPDERKAAQAIDRLATDHPEAQILVLSEYSFFGPIPPGVRKVVKKHHRYLIAGGTQTLTDDRYYNTAYVIGPDGRDVFSQAKSVPVQFMSDGLAAPQRRVWESPWGKIGIAVCYDLSYAKVMDDFVRQGAQGLIIPTMDLASWGGYERRMLHGRMAPVRSAEYGIPTFGVWSSGESQLTDRFGRIIATAGYPGQGDTIAGPFNLAAPGYVPLDRLLAMAAMWASGLFIVLLATMHIGGWLRRAK
jgi:predicted amidohydrolase